MAEKKTSWGGKRIGAGRKPKSGRSVLKAVPGIKGSIKEFPEFVAKGGNNVGAIGALDVNTMASTSKEIDLAKRKIREGIQTRFKVGKYLACPPDLDQDAKDEWNRLMASYSAQDGDFLCDLDISMLRLFCESKSRYLKAYRKWTKDFKGAVIGDTKDEQSVLDRLIKIRDIEFNNREKLAPDLALTPSGRAKAGMLMAKALTNKKTDNTAQNALDFLGSIGE